MVRRGETERSAYLTVRVTKAGLAEIDRMAADEERDRSSMVRLLLREAVAARQVKRR